MRVLDKIQAANDYAYAASPLATEKEMLVLDHKAELLAVVEAASELLPYDWTAAGWDAGQAREMHDRMSAVRSALAPLVKETE